MTLITIIGFELPTSRTENYGEFFEHDPSVFEIVSRDVEFELFMSRGYSKALEVVQHSELIVTKARGDDRYFIYKNRSGYDSRGIRKRFFTLEEVGTVINQLQVFHISYYVGL